ncbi:MAG TPA: hypothetical protein VLE20_01385, partial [Blastocatellia bacterium]|nr:hypothetical protein [Blastocatellia bacterium]
MFTRFERADVSQENTCWLRFFDVAGTGARRSGLLKRAAGNPAIPQPEGRGCFTSAYNQTLGGASGNPPTGRLGMIHF